MSSFRAVLHRVLLACGIVSLLAAVGCGTGGGTIVTNQSGNFSNASLSGSYVYELHGQSCTNNFSCGATPYREMGVFTADGAGNIGKTTAGSDDISGGTGAVAVTGTYRILKDGTGSITMTSQLGTITLAITMVSNSKIYLIEADAGLVASGVAELQDSSAIGTTPSGNFVFRVHQELSNSGFSASQVGFVTLGTGSGNGAMDENVDGSVSSPNISVTLSTPGALGRGAGTLTDTTSNTTSNFIYYIVNSGKLNLLMSDSNAVGSGSAEVQSGTVANGLSGSYVFGSEGDDINLSTGFLSGFAAVGQFTASGGAISGNEDFAQDGSITSNAAFSACYSGASANGRVVVTNGSGSPCSGTPIAVYWMVNPSRAFFLEIGFNTVDDGTADLQTGASFSASTFKGQYALVMGGIDLTVQQLGFSNQSISRVGAAQLDGSNKLTLNEEVNTLITSSGATSPGVLTGTYAVSSNGRIAGGVANNGGPPLDLVGYGVSGSKAYVLQNDSGLITFGTLELQQ